MPRRSLLRLLTSAALAGAIVPPARAADLRPAAVSWGGYNGNEQLVGADDRWPFVRRYADGFVMHGAYWIAHRHTGGPVPEADVDAAVTALGQALAGGHARIEVETGLVENERDYDPANPAKRVGHTAAERDAARFRHWATLGVHVGKVRVDWFPMQAAAVYAQHFQTTATAELMARVTGDARHWGAVPGFDPAQSDWLEYAAGVTAALPGVRLGFDQAPCNFFRIPPDPAVRGRMPWPGLGWGYRSDGLKFLYSKRPAAVAGRPVPVAVDFADLLLSVAAASRAAGLNFQSFDGDTPYAYVTDNKGRQGKGLLPFLLDIERTLHRNGLACGKIINDPSPATVTDHDAWDRRFHDRTMAYLEAYQTAGGRADEYIAESWYAGPFTFFPETRPGTFANLARDLIRRLRGIDDDGSPFPLSLAVTPVEGGVRVTVTNGGHDRNPGDARATPLLRATVDGPGLTATTDDGRDVTAALLAAGDADGWFAGGLDAGGSASVCLRAPAATRVLLQAYWNPQDPTRVSRATASVTVP